MSRKMILTSLGLALPLAALALSGWVPREAPSRIAGTFAARYTEQHPAPISDATGHMIMLGRAQGINRNTGPTPYMDRAKVTNVEFADLVQGNGPQQGYISMSSGPDTVISKWSGKVTTTLSPEQTPITTFQGTWSKVKGTGRYKAVAGSGNYRGRFTSQTEYTVDWDGELSGALAEK
ncbi:MAG: hypothetical protein ACREMZ_12325 [Gemmatimonadales bacterium]